MQVYAGVYRGHDPGMLSLGCNAEDAKAWVGIVFVAAGVKYPTRPTGSI